MKGNRELETTKSKEVNDLEDKLEKSIEEYEHTIETIKASIQDQGIS